MQTEFTLADLTKLTGVKRRTVQLWAEAAVIEAMADTERAGTGVHRRFSRQEAMIACVLAPLTLFQLSIGALKWTAAHIRETFNDDSQRIERVVREGLPLYLLIATNAKRGARVRIIDPTYGFEKERENWGVLRKLEERLLPIRNEDDDHSMALGRSSRRLVVEFDAEAIITLPITARLQPFR